MQKKKKNLSSLNVDLALAQDPLVLGVGDQAVDGVEVRLGGRVDNIRVRTVAMVRRLDQAVVLHLNLIALGSRPILLRDLDRDLSQSVDTLTHRRNIKLEETDLPAYQALDCNKHRLNWSGLAYRRIRDDLARLGVLELYRCGGDRGARYDLERLDHISGVLARGGRHLVRQQGNQVLFRHALLAIRQGLEAVKRYLELCLCQLTKAQLLQTGAERGAARVLAQDQVNGVGAHGFGADDLVRGLVLEHAVLVDSGLVQEGIGADDGLVGLDDHTGQRRYHL